jgi:hypothetical protein
VLVVPCTVLLADSQLRPAAQIDPRTGIPICFYTGARLRTNRDVLLPHPPAEHDMGLKHIETQCCAVCDPGEGGAAPCRRGASATCSTSNPDARPCLPPPDDELLVHWRKVPMPLMELPHTGQLTAWRDPWFVEQGDGAGTPWTMLIGSGLRGAGGTALVYRTQELTRGGAGVGGRVLVVGWSCPAGAHVPSLSCGPELWPHCTLQAGSSWGICAATPTRAWVLCGELRML